MGFISNLTSAPPQELTVHTKSPFQGRFEGQRLWQRVFGGVSKEDRHETKPPESNSANSYIRSASSAAAFKRLLEAMRSDAPGGWSDDRFEQTRRFTGIVYVAVHRICTQWQQAEFQVFEKDDNHPDGKKPVTKHTQSTKKHVRPYDLIELLEKPNRQDSFGKWMYRIGQQKYLTGTGLNWMVPNELGVPYEMYCIPTSIAIPQPVINPEFPNGFWRIQPVYPYGPFSSYPTPNTALGAPIPGEWMLRFMFPHPLLRYDGYSPLTGMRLTLDVIDSIYKSRWYAMKRSINPSAVLNMEGVENANTLTEEEIERLRSMFEESHMGPENVGQLLVPTPGAKIEPWGAKPMEMDYGSGWEQETGFAMGGFGISKEAAGMMADNSYATLFATLKQLHLLTLEPDLNDIASDLTRHLAPFFGDNLIIEIRCKRIDDHEVRNGKIQLAMSAKCITKNQVLKELDMPTTREEWGDEIAGESSEPEVPAGMGGMGGGGGGGDMGGGFPGGGMGGEGDLESEGIGDIEPEGEGGEAPTPNTLGEGSLGPRGASLLEWNRKGLNGVHTKAIPPMLHEWLSSYGGSFLGRGREGRPLSQAEDSELSILADAVEESGWGKSDIFRQQIVDLISKRKERGKGDYHWNRFSCSLREVYKHIEEILQWIEQQPGFKPPKQAPPQEEKRLNGVHTKSNKDYEEILNWMSGLEQKLIYGFSVEVGEELLIYCDKLEENSIPGVDQLREVVTNKLKYFQEPYPQVPYESEEERKKLEVFLTPIREELERRVGRKRLNDEERQEFRQMLQDFLMGKAPLYFLEMWLEEHGATPEQIETWSERWQGVLRETQEGNFGEQIEYYVCQFSYFDAMTVARLLGTTRSKSLNGVHSKSKKKLNTRGRMTVSTNGRH